jgi:molecular chaperone DnaK (HSP70)
MASHFHRVIGIDLGTTYSAVAAFHTYNEQAEIITNTMEDDSDTTPSVVALEPLLKKAIVGRSAKRQIENPNSKPEDIVIEIKREMGDNFKDAAHLNKYHAEQAFQVGQPVQVFFAGHWRKPQEISALILMKMKEIAEKEIGETIRDAVITVPAYFMEPQRKATEEAALLAGLYPRQLIPEPTAAAICYGLDKRDAEKRTYLVYDLGGGTFDVTVIQVEGSNINVVATSGNHRLGGGDFDDRLTQWIINELLKKQVDVRNDPSNIARIKARVEQAKILLSSNEETIVDLMFLQRHDVVQNITVTKQIFEGCIQDLLDSTLDNVEDAISQSHESRGISREQIDAILLVGGSSKIPKVRSMLLSYFDKDESFVKTEVNPDAVVARGAAIMGYRFQPSPSEFNINQKTAEGLTNPDALDLLNDVNLIAEHSLGVGLADKTVSKIVERGTYIPVTEEREGFGNAEKTSAVDIGVYQGEGKYIYDNDLIGTLRIDGLDPNIPAGGHQFKVTFTLDQNGLLTMTVLHLNENKPYQATFDQSTGVKQEDLSDKREKLLKLYASTSTAQAPPTAQTGAQSPPPPPPSTPPRPDTAQPGTPSPQPATAPETAQTPSTTAPAPEPETPQFIPPPQPDAAPGTAQAAQTPPAQPAPQTPTEQQSSTVPGLIEPALPVPEQFKQTVRRARKHLIKSFDQELLDAFNQFITALNSNADIDEMEDKGDNLADVFDKLR